METITLKELAQKLGYRNIRSASKWCANNGVVVLSDIGTRFKYVLRTEFEAARLKTFILYLKKRYGEKHWLEAYKAHMDFNITHILDLNNASRNNHSGTDKKLPVDTGKNGQKFLDQLNNLTA